MRKYPESGPERRAREEYECKLHGEGEYKADNCQKCKQPFSPADIAKRLHIIKRRVSPSGSHGNPAKVYETDAICSVCTLQAKVAHLEEREASRRRHAEDVAKTCQVCGEYYKWIGTGSGYECGCGYSGNGAFGRPGGPHRL